MREINHIYNEDCFETMRNMEEHSVDVIMTSPFYNTNVKAGSKTLLDNGKSEKNYDYIRYDTIVDNMTDEEYSQFTVDLFNLYDRVLKPNGCIIYNISYGQYGADAMIDAIFQVAKQTNFTVADMVAWKKKSAVPNNTSPNKLTRIWEPVFIFCRKDEFYTYASNKKEVSKRATGQAVFENIYNFVEAKNNDGTCPYNKATYSTELCQKLLKIYCPEGGTVYDSFMGTGTTAIACIRMGFNYIGSEKSENQVKWANDRINRETSQIRWDFT